VKAKDPAGTTGPDIPADIRELTLSDGIFAEPEISFRECLIENISFKDRSLKSLVIEACVLKRVSFARCNLQGWRQSVHQRHTNIYKPQAASAGGQGAKPGAK
jgi:hypothetical protein